MFALFIIVVIDLIGFGIIIPLLPFYAEFFQASPFMVGLIMATYSLAQFISAPVLGRLSDQFGRRPVLLFSLLGAVISYILLGFASQLWILFLARALGGLMAGNIAAAFAYVADVTTSENRARGMGLIGAAFGLGFIIGPAIGGLLAGPDPATADYQSPAFAAAALSGVAFIVALFVLKESLTKDIRERLKARPRENRLQQFKRHCTNKNIIILIVISFFATAAFAGLEATFAIWTERKFDFGPEQNGYLFAFVGILSAAVQGGLSGRMAKRFGEARMLIQGAAALCIGIVMIPFSVNIPMLVIALGIAGYGFSIISPALNSLISLNADKSEQGAVIGVSRSATTLARVAGPAVAGALFLLFGMDWPYYFGAMMMVLVIYLGLSVRAELERVQYSER